MKSSKSINAIIIHWNLRADSRICAAPVPGRCKLLIYLDERLVEGPEILTVNETKLSSFAA
jgi:hypothetical protein